MCVRACPPHRRARADSAMAHPTEAAKALVELVAARVALALNDRHDRAPRVPRKETPYLAVCSQREVGIREVDHVLEAQAACDDRGEGVEQGEDHRPAGPHDVARPSDEVHVRPLRHLSAQRRLVLRRHLRIHVQEEEVAFVAARGGEGSWVLEGVHVAVEGLVRVRARRHDEVHQTYRRPTRHCIRKWQR